LISCFLENSSSEGHKGWLELKSVRLSEATYSCESRDNIYCRTVAIPPRRSGEYDSYDKAEYKSNHGWSPLRKANATVERFRSFVVTIMVKLGIASSKVVLVFPKPRMLPLETCSSFSSIQIIVRNATG
jgi:hypothetical protein